MFNEKSKVLYNDQLCRSYYRMGLACDRIPQHAVAGQFVMIQCQGQTETLLRRPFSIHNVIEDKNGTKGVEILYRVVGKATQRFSACQPGDDILVLGPLGNGFQILPQYKRHFLVAGGVGIAPMPLLAAGLNKAGIQPLDCLVFIGGQSKDDILCQDIFQDMKIKTHLSTDDGSHGHKGFVTQIFEQQILKQKPDIIYACGPTPMLKAVGRISTQYGIACQLSVETMMACGMGACLGCAVASQKDKQRYLHACKDGPVFNADEIEFD